MAIGGPDRDPQDRPERSSRRRPKDRQGGGHRHPAPHPGRHRNPRSGWHPERLLGSCLGRRFNPRSGRYPERHLSPRPDRHRVRSPGPRSGRHAELSHPNRRPGCHPVRRSDSSSEPCPHRHLHLHFDPRLSPPSPAHPSIPGAGERAPSATPETKPPGPSRLSNRPYTAPRRRPSTPPGRSERPSASPPSAHS